MAEPNIPAVGRRYRITDFVGAVYEGTVTRVLIGGRDEGIEAGHVKVEFADCPGFITNLPCVVEENHDG